MKIEFLLEAEMSDFYFSVLKDDAAFFKNSEENFSIRMVPDKDYGKKIEIRCLSDAEVDSEIYKFVDGFIKRRYLIGINPKINLPYIVRDEEQIDAEGNIKKGFPCPLDLLPDDVQLICKEKGLLLNSTLMRFLSLLRWHQNIENSHRPLKNSPSFYWRTAGEGFYHAVPSPRHPVISLKMMKGIKWSESEVAELEKIWKSKDIEEPLAHELLREAVSVLDSSPRSALLILCSALEIAVKQHVGYMVPKSTWLITELPSPPIIKILNKYFPELHPDSTVVPSWEKLRSLFKIFDEMIVQRNKLAHRGEFSDVDRLGKYIDCVRNFLYIIDALEGHEWAKSRVDTNIKELLGWPVNADDKLFNGVLEVHAGF